LPAAALPEARRAGRRHGANFRPATSLAPHAAYDPNGIRFAYTCTQRTARADELCAGGQRREFCEESIGMDNIVDNTEHQEGPVARAIEEQTAKLPSDFFLWAALGSIGISLILQLTGHKEKSLFVGQWPPTFLILGLYNKIVKVEGHDQFGD
jgi:hypothetical protein